MIGALFVDFENVYYSLLNPPFGLRKDAALSATLDAVNELRRKLREAGTALIVERSYADWEQLPSTAQRQLSLAGIVPKFTDGKVDKNTADIELSLDVLQNTLLRGELQHIALVGGDRDYLPILRRIKELHRRITVCALKQTLSGDVREFVSNYAEAAILELDDLIALDRYERAKESPRLTQPVLASASNGGERDPLAASSQQVNEWHERYVEAMLLFMRGKKVREVFLGPFFKWLGNSGTFALVSVREQKQILEDLKVMGVVLVEERDGNGGYPFNVATINWNHPLVQRLNAE